MTAIIVWFFINTSTAAFCTQPMPAADATRNIEQIFAMWQAKKPVGLTPPVVMTSDHPNYAAAFAICKTGFPQGIK